MINFNSCNLQISQAFRRFNCETVVQCVRYIYLQLLSGLLFFEFYVGMAFVCRPHASIPYVICGSMGVL